MSDWVKSVDPGSGRDLWVNHKTRETSWSAPQVLQPLPSNWEERRDDQGRVFYIDHDTRTTTWIDPRLTAASQPAAAAATTPTPDAFGGLSAEELEEQRRAYEQFAVPSRPPVAPQASVGGANFPDTSNDEALAALLAQGIDPFANDGPSASTAGGGGPPDHPQLVRQASAIAPFRVPDAQRKACLKSGLPFVPIQRPRHHCRSCGEIFSDQHSDHRAHMPFAGENPTDKEQRVCDWCWEYIERGSFGIPGRFITMIKFSDAPRPDRVESVTALAETLQKRSVSSADLARDMDRYGGPTPLLAGFADLLTVGAEGGSTDGRLGAVAEGLATLVDHVSGLNPSAYASPEAPDEDFREIFFEAAVEAGIMDLAVSLLSPPGGVAPSPVEPASQLLFFLTQYRPLRDLVERSHGLGPFLDLLTDPNTGTQMWIAATMWGLLDSNPSGAKLLVDRGGVFLLCTLLSLGPEQESVMAHAIHALSAALGALLHPPTPGSRDRNTDAADAGVEARGEEPTRDERHAARDRFVSEVLTHGAVGAALSLMHAGDAKRVSVTAKFLRLLAGQKDVASALHREGALTLASRALAQGAGSASLKVDLLRILGVVVAGTDRRPHAAKEAIDAGVLDAAVPLLRAPEPSLRASAAHLVAELAQDGIQGPVVAAAPGLYEALEKQLMDPSMAQANPSASVDPDPTLPLYHAALAGVAKVVAWEGRYAGSAGGAGTIGLAAMQSGMWTFAESLLQAQNPKSQASAAEVIHGLASHGDATVRGLVHASITPDAPLMTTLGNVAATTLEIHLGGGAEEGQRLIEVTQACLLALGSLAGGVPMVRGEDPTQWMMSVGVGTSADDAMAEAFREAAYRAGALATALRSLDITKDGSETELQIAALRFLEVLCRPPPPPATQSASSALSARCRSALDLHAASYVVDLLHDAASSSHPLRALLGLRAFADLAPYMSRTAPELKQGLGAVSRLLMPQSDSAQPDPGRMRLSLEAMSVVQMLSNTMDPPPDLSGILPAMIEMLFMDKHLSDPSVNSVTLATGVLRVLAKMVQNPDQAQMVVDQGGVFPLASLLRKARDALMTGTEDETGDWAGQGSVGCLLEACLECLRSLVRSPREDIRERVMQTGEMGVLLVLVDDAVLQLGLTSVPARAADAAAKTQWEVVVLWTLQTLEALLSDTRAQLHPEALLVSSISPSTGRSQRKVPNPNPKASNYTDREGSPLDSIAELCIPRAESALLSPKSDAPKDADPRAALLALATSQAQLLLRRLGAVTADPGAAARFWGTLVSGGHLFALLALLATPWATEGGAASPFPNATVAALKSGASAALVEMVSWGTETETWNSLGVDLLLKNLKTSVNAARVVQTLCARPPVQARILGEAPLLTPLVESFFDQNLARVAMEALAAVVRSEELPDEKAILFAKGLHATGLRPKLLRSLAAAVTAGHQPEPRATSLLLAVLAGMEAGAAASPTPTEAFGLPDAEAEIFAKNPEFFRRLLRLHATGMQPGQNRTGSALVEQQRLRQSLSLLLSAPAVVPAVTQAGFDLKKALQQGTNPLDRALGLSLLRALLHSSDSAAQSTLSQTVPAVIALTTQSLDALATQRHVAEEDLRVAETAAQVLVAMVRTPENTFSGPFATEAADDVAFLDAPNGLRAFFRPLSSLAERVRNGPGDAESAGHAGNGATANGAADASEPNLLLGDAVPAATPQATGLGDAADADPKAADDLLLRLVPRTLAATLHLVSAAQPARYREAVLAAVPEPLLQLLDTLSSGTFDNYFPEHPALPELLLLLVHTTTVLASVPTAEGRGHQHSLWVAVAKMAEFVVTRSHTPTPPDWKLSHIVEIRQILWQNLAMGAGRGDFGVQVRSVATAAIRGVLDDLMSPSVKKERALWFELRSALTLLERVERLKVSPSAASATDVEVAVPEGTSLLNADLAELSGPAAAPARSGTPADGSPALSTEAVAAILDALHVAVAAIAKAAPADAIEARTGAVEQLLRLVADVAADGVTRDAEASTSDSASPAAQLRDGIWNAPQTLDGLRAAALHEKRSTLPETLQCVCAQIVHLLDLADPHLGAANASPELRANLLYFAQLLPPGATRLLGPALGLAPTPSSAQDGADHPGLALDAPAALVDPFAHDQASATALEAALDAARTPFGVVEASPAPVPAAHTSYNYAQAPQGPPPKPAPAPAPPAAAFDPFRGFGAAAAAAAATATPENAGVPPSYGALMGGEKSGTEAPPSYGNLF